MCLALNIYHEARGEPDKGKQGVAMVTLNRADHDQDKVCEVVFQPMQMSWTNGKVERRGGYWMLDEGLRPKNEWVWKKSLVIASRNLQSRQDDPTRGATFFHATHVNPKWAKYAVRTAQIGNHFFYTMR